MAYRVRTILGFLLVLLIFAILFCLGLKHPSRAKLSQSSVANAMKKDVPLLSGKKLLFIIPPKDFRDEELFETKKLLAKSGATSYLASTTIDSVRGMLGAKVRPDYLISELKANAYDAVIFIGGSGCKTLWDNIDSQRLAREAFESGKVVAAICIAPVILARADLLTNCDATVFSSQKNEITKVGAKYIDNNAVKCGRIVTANGPEAVEDFAKAIEEVLLVEYD